MLDEMHISNVALIHDAHFEPCDSLTVITGETGSGKTALLNALKLLVGERAESGMVREGADELRVEGRFYFADSDEDGEVVSRRMGVNGRSRVSINQELSSVKELAQGIGASVDLCGQHEHQRLLSAAHQRELIDVWGGASLAEAHAAYKQAFSEARAAQDELQALREKAQEGSLALQQAQFVISQIDKVGLVENEYETLLEEMPRYEHAEMLVRESDSAYRSLSEEESALSFLEQACSSLDKVASIDSSLRPQAEALRGAYYEVEEVAHVLAAYRRSAEFSPEEFESRQQRLSALQGLMRVYGPRMEDVFESYRRAEEEVSLFTNSEEILRLAEEKVARAEGELHACAEVLARVRAEVLPLLASEVNNQIARLQMGSAYVCGSLVDLPRDSWNEWGSQSFELLFAPAHDLKPQKLNQIASGGEMSRVMLAIKVVLGKRDAVDTLVFDEIDAGVGGETARALADVISDLAQSHQVIVVTHLPQVAVLGNRHYVVEKMGEDATQTTLRCVEGDERVREIARMLAGDYSEVSLQHARELLQSVQA